MTALRIVVQHRETKYFCQSEGTWTDKEEEARDFPNVLDAFEFASQGYLDDVEILFRPKARYLPQNGLSIDSLSP